MGWILPQEGWVKLNTDSCCRGDTNHAAGGGVLRNCSDDWLGGFSVRIGECSVVEAKIWALIYGLRLAWAKGIKFLSIEIDSLQVTKWLNGHEDDFFHHYNLLVECKTLLNKDWRADLQHVF